MVANKSYFPNDENKQHHKVFHEGGLCWWDLTRKDCAICKSNTQVFNKKNKPTLALKGIKKRPNRPKGLKMDKELRATVSMIVTPAFISWKALQPLSTAF